MALRVPAVPLALGVDSAGVGQAGVQVAAVAVTLVAIPVNNVWRLINKRALRGPWLLCSFVFTGLDVDGPHGLLRGRKAEGVQA